MTCEEHNWFPVSFEREEYSSKVGLVIFVCKNHGCNKFKEEHVRGDEGK